ncbi:MAG: hypothetical protein K6E59_03975 [Bacilli bacterium]|nr:hypothetical protein [Bacilli bacterium]
MRKRKGAALPAAIMLCMFMLVVTFSVAYLVVHNATLHNLENLDSSLRLEFLASYTKFQSTGTLAGIESENLDYSSLQADGEVHDIQAFLGKNKGGVLKAYAIYDFTAGETLAYQDREFYLDGSGLPGGYTWEVA